MGGTKAVPFSLQILANEVTAEVIVDSTATVLPFFLIRGFALEGVHENGKHQTVGFGFRLAHTEIHFRSFRLGEG
jgi:hypothetical protein